MLCYACDSSLFLIKIYLYKFIHSKNNLAAAALNDNHECVGCPDGLYYFIFFFENIININYFKVLQDANGTVVK